MPPSPQEACAFGARQFLQSWPLTLTTKPSTSKLSDNPDSYSFRSDHERIHKLQPSITNAVRLL